MEHPVWIELTTVITLRNDIAIYTNTLLIFTEFNLAPGFKMDHLVRIEFKVTVIISRL